MIIGYDAKRIVNNNTGLGSYGRNLINSLVPLLETNDKLLLYTPSFGNEQLRSQVIHSNQVQYVYPQNASNGLMRSLWRTFGITKQIKANPIDLFHGLSGELPIGIKHTNTAAVVTIHDLIFLRHPEFYNPLDVAIYRWKFKKACQEADRMIAISERTKFDIMHFGNYPEERIDVIYQSASQRFQTHLSDNQLQTIRNKFQLPQQFILNVGTIEKRKNVLLAVKALPLLSNDTHLVIVGRNTPYTKEIEAWAKSHNLSDRVHILNNVNNDDLAGIYQLATCFVYPSRYEGFGLPIIEAIQCGLSVVACTGSCLEEAGGDSCLYVHPDDVEGMAAALKQLLDNPEERVQRAQKAREYVTRFENNNVAAQVQQQYLKTIETKRLSIKK